MKRPTMADIARRAGVTKGAVSFALNGKPGVSEVTRRRIYIETLQDVMPAIRSKIIVDEQTRSILPLLNLDSHKGERP